MTHDKGTLRLAIVTTGRKKITVVSEVNNKKRLTTIKAYLNRAKRAKRSKRITFKWQDKINNY